MNLMNFMETHSGEILSFSFLVAASIQDIQKKKLSPLLCITFGILGILYISFFDGWDFTILLSLIPGAFFILLSFISRGQVGLGDGIALIILGLFLNIEGIICTTVTALLASSLFAFLMLLIKKKGRRYSFPFIPFLLFGDIIYELIICFSCP